MHERYHYDPERYHYDRFPYDRYDDRELERHLQNPAGASGGGEDGPTELVAPGTCMHASRDSLCTSSGSQRQGWPRTWAAILQQQKVLISEVAEGGSWSAAADGNQDACETEAESEGGSHERELLLEALNNLTEFDVPLWGQYLLLQGAEHRWSGKRWVVQLAEDPLGPEQCALPLAVANVFQWQIL